jgi:hypothetical protein
MSSFQSTAFMKQSYHAENPPKENEENRTFNVSLARQKDIQDFKPNSNGPTLREIDKHNNTDIVGDVIKTGKSNAKLLALLNPVAEEDIVEQPTITELVEKGAEEEPEDRQEELKDDEEDDVQNLMGEDLMFQYDDRLEIVDEPDDATSFDNLEQVNDDEFEQIRCEDDEEQGFEDDEDWE